MYYMIGVVTPPQMHGKSAFVLETLWLSGCGAAARLCVCTFVAFYFLVGCSSWHSVLLALFFLSYL